MPQWHSRRLDWFRCPAYCTAIQEQTPGIRKHLHQTLQNKPKERQWQGQETETWHTQAQQGVQTHQYRVFERHAPLLDETIDWNHKCAMWSTLFKHTGFHGAPVRMRLLEKIAPCRCALCLRQYQNPQHSIYVDKCTVYTYTVYMYTAL